MLVVVFVVCDAVAKADFTSQPGFSQELQGAIDSRLSNAGVVLLNQTVKIFAGKMLFRAQKDVENQIALRSALKALLLDMFEKNFLLFSHSS